MRKKTSWIFKACAIGTLGAGLAASYTVHDKPEADWRHAVLAQAVEQSMRRDFMRCTAERISEDTSEWTMMPVTGVGRLFGEKDGMPSLEGGTLRLETSVPDYIQGNIATMVTELDRETGKVTKRNYNYVSPIHKAQHEIMLRAASSCLNAHGPMV